ncbi:MAG: sterol desaturase family protein [Gammaproteobacteria bacterium]|nr:sterol desaturase family protein [Gammaproteobacteria bacterium]
MQSEQVQSGYYPHLAWLLYPILFCAMSAYAWFELQQPSEQIGVYRGYYVAVLMLSLITIEALYPAQRKWRMTLKSFFMRDAPYMIIGATTIALMQYIAITMVIEFGIRQGQTHQTMPLIPGVILCLLIVDFFWYWIHRYSHESNSKFGQWCWKIHLAHHLPQQVYVLMHAVAHPINFIVARSIFTLPLYFLGFSVEALFVANLIIGLQGTISHFNVDLRVGWINYLLVGTELHRYHHSADPEQGKNYGSVVPIWDIIFGTFYYRPNQLPQQLGISKPENYPVDRQVWQVMLLPFRKTQS